MKKVAGAGILKRSWKITWIGARYFVFYKINRHRSEPLGRRFRLACEELGLVFIKLGQILSTRYDLLSNSDCKELQSLLDNVPAFDPEMLDVIFKKDFGKTQCELFARFDPHPIASASIAQVYAAFMADGTKLAVKVRRPDAEDLIKSDIRILRRLAEIAKWFVSDLQNINTDKIVRELEVWLIAEVDFANEIKNIDSFKEFYDSEYMREVAPEYVSRLVFLNVHKELSSRNVITMDFIEGVPLKDVSLIRDNPEYDIRTSCFSIIGAIMRAWMGGKDMYFHADPHPSNVLLLPHGRLALLDFGLLGKLDSRSSERIRDIFLSVYAKNAEQTIRKGLDFVGMPYDPYAERIREDIRAYIEKAQHSGLGYWFMDFIRIFIRHRINLPYEIILFGRMEIIMDGSIEVASPGETTLNLLGEELRQGIRRRIEMNVKDIDLTSLLYVLSEKIKESPENVAGLIDKYADDPLQAVRDLREAVR